MTLPLPHDDVVPTEDEISELGSTQAMVAAFRRAQENYEKLRQQWPLGSGSDIARVSSCHASVAGVSVANATFTPGSFAAATMRGSLVTWAIGSPTRFTIGAAGLYLATAHASYAASGAGQFYAGVSKNGSGVRYQAAQATATADPHCGVTFPLVLAAGDYLEAHAYQTSGGSITTTIALDVVRLGP